jgi:prepilin-type processing-associated H-X9-DG protein
LEYFHSPFKAGYPPRAGVGELKVADYALCAWGSGGKGTLKEPDWLWPGGIDPDPTLHRSMLLAEVRRPAATIQFADGATFTFNGVFPGSHIRRRHRNGILNAAFLDGHARVVPDQLWNQVGQDERGYFYWISAANR